MWGSNHGVGRKQPKNEEKVVDMCVFYVCVLFKKYAGGI